MTMSVVECEQVEQIACTQLPVNGAELKPNALDPLHPMIREALKQPDYLVWTNIGC